MTPSARAAQLFERLSHQWSRWVQPVARGLVASAVAIGAVGRCWGRLGPKVDPTRVRRRATEGRGPRLSGHPSEPGGSVRLRLGLTPKRLPGVRHGSQNRASTGTWSVDGSSRGQRGQWEPGTGCRGGGVRGTTRRGGETGYPAGHNSTSQGHRTGCPHHLAIGGPCGSSAGTRSGWVLQGHGGSQRGCRTILGYIEDQLRTPLGHISDQLGIFAGSI